MPSKMLFSKTFGFLMSSNVLVVIISIFIGAATSRILGVEGRGEFYLFIQIVSLGTIIFSLGIHSAIQYHLSKEIISKDDIASMIILQLIATSIVLFLLQSFLNSFLTLTYNMSILILISVLLGISILYLNSVMMTFSEGIKNTSILAPASSAVQLFVFIFLVVVLSDQFQKLSYAITAFIIGNIFRIIFSFYTVGKFNFNLKKKYLTDFKKLYKFAAASFLANLSVMLLFKLDIFMISSMLGYAELGIYSAAVTLIEMVLIVPTVIGTSLFTHLPTIGSKERIALVRKTLLGVMVMSIFLLIMLSIFGRIIIIILFGELFIEAIYPLLYLMPGIFFMSLNYCFANYFSGIGRPIITGCIFTIGVLINFILNLYFIPILGILGASIASSIAYFFVTLMFIYALWQFEKINSMELFVFSRKEIINLQFYIKNKLNFFK